MDHLRLSSNDTGGETMPSSSPSGMSCDWRLCMLCQEKKNERESCPANAKQKVCGSTYDTLAAKLEQFHGIGALPPELADRLQIGTGINLAKIMRENKAVIHDKCRLMYTTSRLKRKMAQPKQDEENEDGSDLQSQETSDTQERPRKSSRKTIGCAKFDEGCCICEQIPPTGQLRKMMTWTVWQKFKEYATIVEDHRLMALSCCGDGIAQEVKYHRDCFIKLHRQWKKTMKAKLKEEDSEFSSSYAHGVILSELTAYMEEAREETAGLKLAELRNMYAARQQDFGITTTVHSSRLKKRLLMQCCDLEARTQGRDVLLTFSSELTEHLKVSIEFDEEAMCLAKAARMLRRDLLQHKSFFGGRYEKNCQGESVPPSMQQMMQMIIFGPGINNERKPIQAVHSIGQIISFNVQKTGRGKEIRHSKEREPPVPVYISLQVHAETRKRDLVDTLHSLALGISYRRVLEISTQLATKACDQFRHDGVVCRLKLRTGVFMTAAVDNIDYNPSSTTAKDSFHGTAISIFQHLEQEHRGEEREVTLETLPQSTSSTLTVPELPHSYTYVPPFALKLPVQPSPWLAASTPDEAVFSAAAKKEQEWLEMSQSVVNAAIDGHKSSQPVSWGAYHADQQKVKPADCTPGISSMLPLFHENSKSPAMMKHSLDIVRSAVNFLNPGQTPVLTADQPLFALAKQIQWQLPLTHGPGKIIMVLGGLHTEQAFMKAIGTLLRQSGWTDVLATSDIISVGVADSCLSVAHIARTRHAHQITSCTLSALMKMAYSDYCQNNIIVSLPMSTFAEWRESMIKSSATFYFWDLVLELELLLLVFLTSLRDGNFKVYLEALRRMVPWFFALDQQNYARWLSVHIKDMEDLPKVSLPTFEQFCKGHFVLQKSGRPFSKIALDQAHEHNNALIKGDGGAVGLTDNHSALRRWMIGGPEVSRLLQELDQSLLTSSYKPAHDQHHENSAAFQADFTQDVTKFLVMMSRSNANPYVATGGDLLTLTGTGIAPTSVSESIRTLKQIGTEQSGTFLQERLLTNTKALAHPIKRNNVALFAGVKHKARSSSKVALMKSNVSLFAGLYVACQTRSGGLKDFFKFENQSTPPSLSLEGMLRPANKSTLLTVLEPLAPLPPTELPETDTVLVDGAAAVNFLKPHGCRTFASYAFQVFLPYMQYLAQKASRLDVIWDRYAEDSLKNGLREKRGIGHDSGCRRVTPDGKLPSDWSSFLKVSRNKQELFSFLAQALVGMDTDKLVISTQEDIVISNKALDKQTKLSPCNHEEADTRLILHLADAAQNHKRILIRTVDTDVVVLAIAAAARHSELEVWIAMGVGLNYRFISAHDIASNLGTERAKCLPFFHSFTGCDTVSAFNGVGKKTAWDAWQLFPEVSEAFKSLSLSPADVSSYNRALIERYVTHMYDRTSDFQDVNSMRGHLFTKMGRQIDHIPPTSEALLQHTKRATYQGGHIWGQTEVSKSYLPSPADWGWQLVDSVWQPFWSALGEASKTCRELWKCGCKKGCKRARCRCAKVGLKCTALCKCSLCYGMLNINGAIYCLL